MSSPRRRVAEASAATRTHPCHQLRQRERLDQIVGGAGFKAGDTILHLASGREHDHRQRGLCGAQRLQDLETSPAREHQVQDDHVEALTQRGALSGDSIQLDRDGEALRLQPALDEVHDPGLVLDQQDTCRARSARGPRRLLGLLLHAISIDGQDFLVAQSTHSMSFLMVRLPIA
jgi:hypothetical protein